MYEIWRGVSKHTHITRMRKAGQFEGVMKYVIYQKRKRFQVVSVHKREMKL